MSIANFDVIFLLDNAFKDAGDPRVKRALQCFMEKGYTVALLCMEQKDLKEFETIENIPVYRVLPKKLFHFTSYFFFYKKTARKVLSGFSFKYIYSNDHLMLHLGAAIKRLHPAILIHDSHEFFQDYQIEFNNSHSFSYKWKSKIARAFQKRAEIIDIKSADYLITSSYSLASILDYIHRPKYPCITIRNIPDFSPPYPRLSEYYETVYLELEKIKKCNNLIYFGDYYKLLNGMEMLFQGLSLSTDFHLIIVGNDKSNGYFSEEINRLQIQDRVSVISRVPQFFLPEIASYASIAIIPTMECGYLQCYYSLPNKFLDSIKLRLPIIATSLPEHKRIIDEYENGILVDGINKEKAAKQLVDAYATILNNYIFYKEKAENAAPFFSIKNEFEPLFKILNDRRK